MAFDFNILNKFGTPATPPSRKKGHTTKLSGKTTERNGIKFLVSENTTEDSLKLPSVLYFEKEYRGCLELLYGVRGKKAEKLLGCGINDLPSAIGDPRHGEDAKKALETLSGGFDGIKTFMSERFGASNRLMFLLLSYFIPEELLFLDLETKSLNSETAVITSGLGYFDGGKFTVKQFTMLEDSAEYEILEETSKVLKGKKAFVTFNGKTFDIPFLYSRMSYYGFENADALLGMHNFDLLHFSRCAYRGKYESYRLKELEKKVLNFHRDGDIGGEEVEIYYNNFISTQDPSYINPIIEHNRIDVHTMMRLVQEISKKWAE
jgi:uncharacterized protein YprB with RNaseH-like and TPR domain